MPQRRKKVSKKKRRKVSSHGRSKQRPKVIERSFMVNKSFPLLNELKMLVLKATPFEAPNMKKDLQKIGKIKLALMSGSFLGDSDARVDLLVVGENIKLSRLFVFIRNREAELGRELRYVILSPDEFTYRYGMFDRFLTDILESPHQKVINTLRVS